MRSTRRLVIEWDGEVVMLTPQLFAHDGSTYASVLTHAPSDCSGDFTGSAVDDSRPRGKELGEAIKAFSMASPNRPSPDHQSA